MKILPEFYLKLTLCILLSISFNPDNLHAQEAEIWKKYTGAITDPNIPVLPNYGYACYKLGQEAIPEVHSYPVFDVTDYGAVPNDANSDQAAIQAAIDAAEANGSGVVFFPPGEFLVNTDQSPSTSIRIESSNIILKGSGSTPGGTIINMKNQMQAPPGGGGDLNPDLKAPAKAQEKWMDLRVGLSVHWGPSSLGGEEISWSRHAKIKKETYDNYYKEFDPTKFDAEEWAKLMKRWGVKYMASTGKHHDGFCLWFSDYTEYDMENAKLKVDVMDELAKACKKHNIMFGSYYSNLDWYHPDWAPYQYGGPGALIKAQDDSPNLERYFKFMEHQVIELIEKYDVQFLQFDGEWDSTYTHEVGSRLYRRFHEIKPNILLSPRIDIGRRSAGQSIRDGWSQILWRLSGA